MPEENKYAEADDATKKISAQKSKSTDTDVIDDGASEVSQSNSAEATPDCESTGVNIQNVADGENSASADGGDTDIASTLNSVSEDGDQFTLAIPSDEPTEYSTPTDDASSHGDNKGFVSAILKEAPAYDEKKPRGIDGRFDFIELLVFTLAIVFVLTTFVFRHSIVDGDSMQNTLQDGEILIISGLFYTPERYDIVVLEDHSTGLEHPIVKRVIATGGETVKITSKGKIYVDGEEISDLFVFIDKGHENSTYSPMEYTVPEGEIFVMGDHRNNSYDSRMFYGVDADSVLGKVLFRLYPFNRFGSVYGGAEE